MNNSTSNYFNEFDYNQGLIPNDNNNYADVSESTTNNNYNINQNNYNINNYDNNFNNNYYNNNFNNNNPLYQIPNNNNSEQNKYVINSVNVPSNNKLENDKFCCCCYSHDILVNIDNKIISVIFILSFIQIVLSIFLIYLTSDSNKKFIILISIQFFYPMFCIISLINIKCIRYFCCVFISIFSFIFGIFIFLEFIYYNTKINDKKIKGEDYINLIISIRAFFLYLLTHCMFYIFCRTFCERHKKERN